MKSPSPSSFSFRPFSAIAAFVCGGWIAAVAWGNFHFCDDALVSLRTALNTASTGLPVFNHGERVLTFNDPLWVGVEALAVALTTNYAQLIKLVSVGAVAGGVFAVLRRQPGPTAWLLAVCLALVPTFREGLSCGLEVPFIVLLLGLAEVQLRQEGS